MTGISSLPAQTGVSVAALDLLVTVDVSDTSLAPTGTDKKLTIGDLALAVGGWLPDLNTWTFVSSTTGAGGGLITFKVSGVDVTGYLTPGTKVSWNDATNTPGYGVIATSAFSTDTTITLIKQSDYVMANHAITAARYSYGTCPPGFPAKFNWLPTYSGWSANPTSGIQEWWSVGRTIFLNISDSASGTSNNASHTRTLPTQAATVSGGAWGTVGVFTDNSTVQAGYGAVSSAGTTVVLFAVLASNTNTATGNSAVNALTGASYPF